MAAFNLGRVDEGGGIYQRTGIKEKQVETEIILLVVLIIILMIIIMPKCCLA